MEKKIDIIGKYDEEIAEINDILQGLYNGRVYGLNGNNCSMDGSLQHNVTKLTKNLNQLFTKIEYGKDSISDEIAEMFMLKSEK